MQTMTRLETNRLKRRVMGSPMLSVAGGAYHRLYDARIERRRGVAILVRRGGRTRKIAQALVRQGPGIRPRGAQPLPRARAAGRWCHLEKTRRGPLSSDVGPHAFSPKIVRGKLLDHHDRREPAS